jgi:hypothetical protein
VAGEAEPIGGSTLRSSGRAATARVGALASGRAATASGPVAALPSCPDLALLLRGRPIDVVDDPTAACRVDDRAVTLDSALAQDPALAAMAVREGLELAHLATSAGALATDRLVASRILAHVAAVAYSDLVRGSSASLQPLTSAAVRRSVRSLVEALPGAACTAEVVHGVLAALEDRDRTAPRVVTVRCGHLAAATAAEAATLDLAATDAATVAAAVRRACEALPVALPTAVLFSSGGDDRVMVDWAVGENRYGVAPLPRPRAVSYSSCTASSVTDVAYAATDTHRRELVARALNGGLDTTLERAWTAVRSRAGRALIGGTAEGVTIVPTPSGTDAETLALAIAASVGRPVTAILVAPLELGSGTELAATGLAFSDRSPQGHPLCAGERLPGLPVDTESRTVEVRDGEGRLRDADTVEAEIAVHLAEVVAEGRQAMLHVVEGSKTGVRLPRPPAVRGWAAAYGDRLDVVIDAAQLRVEPETVAAHLDAGRLVIVTGSKFLAGPPFSGALLVPPAPARRLDGRCWPPGLAVYLDRAAVPPALPALRRVAPAQPNGGLLLRWSAALTEAEAYRAIAPTLRGEVLRRLAEVAEEALRRSPVVEPVDPAPGEAPTGPGTAPPERVEDLPSIFTFRVLSGGEPLPLSALRTVHALLRTDLSADPSRAEGRADAALAHRIEFGQPVLLGPRGDGGAALRLAFGAPTVCRVATDASRGADLPERLRREAAELRLGLEKLHLIVEHGLARWASVEP